MGEPPPASKNPGGLGEPWPPASPASVRSPRDTPSVTPNLGRRKQEGVFELEDVLQAFGIANVERGPMAPGPVEMDLPRFGHGDVDAVKHDFDGIVLGIVAETKEANPICLDLIAQLERGHVHLNRLGFELLADTIKECAQLNLIKFLGHQNLSSRRFGRP